MRVIHVPRIIAGRAEERTGGPLEYRAVSLKLISGLSRRDAIEGIVVKHRYSTSNTTGAKRRSCMKIVVVNFSRPAAAPAPIFRAVTLHLRVIHMVVPPDPSAAAKIIRTARWQASQSFEIIIFHEEEFLGSEIGGSSERSITIHAR
jgi:hypothetical protein